MGRIPMKLRACFSVSCITLIVYALALALGHPVRYASAAEGYSLWNQDGLGLYGYPFYYESIIPGHGPLVDGESIFSIVKRLSTYPGGARRFTWTPSEVYQFLTTSSAPWTGMTPEGFLTRSPGVMPFGWPAILPSTPGLWPFYGYQWGMSGFYQTTGVPQGIYGLELYMKHP